MPAAFAALALATSLGLGAAWPPHPDAPPVAHTGGFGEPTCHACHFDYAADDGPGRLTLTGLPETVRAGEEYILEVVLEAAGVRAAGFQLSVRTADGRQAGTVAGPAGVQRVATTAAGDVVYVHHTLAGTRPLRPDSSSWRFVWKAPEGVAAAIHFHAAAVAGDADLSPLGDRVYTTTRTVPDL